MPPAEQPTNCEPNEVGRSWKGGAREQADDVFFAAGIKRTSEQSGLCSDVGPGGIIGLGKVQKYQWF